MKLSNFTLGAILLVLVGCGDALVKKCGAVVEVGGCNKQGWCGVKLTDGSFRTAKFPVKGQELCYYERE